VSENSKKTPRVHVYDFCDFIPDARLVPCVERPSRQPPSFTLLEFPYFEIKSKIFYYLSVDDNIAMQKKK
jgi:hypothetical protein